MVALLALLAGCTEATSAAKSPAAAPSATATSAAPELACPAALPPSPHVPRRTTGQGMLLESVNAPLLTRPVVAATLCRHHANALVSTLRVDTDRTSGLTEMLNRLPFLSDTHCGVHIVGSVPTDVLLVAGSDPGSREQIHINYMCGVVLSAPGRVRDGNVPGFRAWISAVTGQPVPTPTVTGE